MITEYERLRHQEILYKLKLARTSLAGVAREMQLSPNTIHAVASSRSRSMRVAMKLSEMTNTPFEILFPEYFENEKGVEK